MSTLSSLVDGAHFTWTCSRFYTQVEFDRIRKRPGIDYYIFAANELDYVVTDDAAHAYFGKDQSLVLERGLELTLLEHGFTNGGGSLSFLGVILGAIGKDTPRIPGLVLSACIFVRVLGAAASM